MKKNSLVYINACIRTNESRTLRIATPIVHALSQRYEVDTINLVNEPVPALTVGSYRYRMSHGPTNIAEAQANMIAQAHRIVIAAPFWDMSFPANLKCFIEQVSLFNITFTDNGSTCVGLCKKPKVLFLTTRGMDISTGDKLEQATPYLKAIGKLWGLGKLTTIAAQNMDYSTPEEVEAKIAACIAEGLDLAKTW